MAYYLKKTKLKGRTYLSICESYYHAEKKQTAQKLYKSLGSVETLMESGIDDPIAIYKKEVDKLNNERKQKIQSESVEQIKDSPMRHLGYFPFKNLMNSLKVKKYLKLLQSVRQFHFDIYEAIEALVYSRIVVPCSKYATFHDVLPCLYDDYDLSYDQIRSACEYLGSEYEKIVEIFTAETADNFGVETSSAYFDCTNFYFEIDKESEFQKKGPSKENKRDPLVGLGLLLDSNQIPIGMKLFPGNESEKPKLREIISDMKNRNHITGRTIQVADKGLNCANNIFAARRNGDGYIFSKSVKQLKQIEKDWIFLDSDDWKDVTDEDGRIRYRYKDCIDEFPYDYIDSSGKKRTVSLTEKRVLTYNPELARKQLFEIEKEVSKARGLCLSKAKKSEFGDCSKYVDFKSTSNGKVTKDKVSVHINEKAVDASKETAGYNLLVTSETSMDANKIYSTYHNLWRIEESFRIMKSELDARPVFLQKENSIKGHFLICYIAVLLERLLQYKVLNDSYGASQLMKFARTFNVVKIENKRYVNITPAGDVIGKLANDLSVPITNYFLDKTQIRNMLNKKITK